MKFKIKACETCRTCYVLFTSVSCWSYKGICAYTDNDVSKKVVLPNAQVEFERKRCEHYSRRCLVPIIDSWWFHGRVCARSHDCISGGVMLPNAQIEHCEHCHWCCVVTSTAKWWFWSEISYVGRRERWPVHQSKPRRSSREAGAGAIRQRHQIPADLVSHPRKTQQAPDQSFCGEHCSWRLCLKRTLAAMCTWVEAYLWNQRFSTTLWFRSLNSTWVQTSNLPCDDINANLNALLDVIS